MNIELQHSASIQQPTRTLQTHHYVTLPLFGHFTFNNSQALKDSMDNLWAQVYQYPQNQGLSLRVASSDNKSQLVKCQSVQTAREAWSIYDPQKQQNFEFNVFKAYKQKAKQVQSTPKQQYRVRKGWGDVFSKPFWQSQYSKPTPFMGAFQHIQPDFNEELNVSVPSYTQYNPYSQYLEEQQILNVTSPYEKKEYSNLLDSKINNSIQQSQNMTNKLYFFQIQSQKSMECEVQKEQKMDLQNIKESRIEKRQQQNYSMVWNNELLFGQMEPFKSVDPAWQNLQNKPIDKITNSRIFEVIKESNVVSLRSIEAQMSLSLDVSSVLPDYFILSEVSKMLQNIECQLFSLDYGSLSWKIDAVAFHPEFFLRSSLSHFLNKVLEMASQRSRLSAAVTFLHKNKYRKIYSELGFQIEEMLIVFQQVVLQLTAKCTLLQFLQNAQRLESQIQLLYNLIINVDYIAEEKKLYEDFDFRFLHSQALIFKRIVKLARNSDAVALSNNNLIAKLLEAAFRPLINLLQHLLFEESAYLQLNSQLYLRYYFPEPKEMLHSIGKKLLLIKQQSIQLYLICKVKEQMQLVHSMKALKRYQSRWARSFATKRKLIERVRRQHKQKQRSQRQKRRQQKMKQIFQLKNRLYQIQEQQSTRKRSVQQKNKKELQMLKKEIEQRQLKRKLIDQLQKQKEKGILLDIELREKQKLAKLKMHLQKKLQLQNQSSQSIQINQAIENAVGVSNKEIKHLQQNIQMQVKQIKQTKIQNVSQKMEAQIHYQKQIVQNQQRPASQTIIHSHKSAELLHQQYMQTADAFFSKKRQTINNKTQNYFQLIGKSNKKVDYESIQNHDSKPQQFQQSYSDEQLMQDQEQSRERQIDLQTCLSVCVDQIVRKQSQVVHHCLQFIIVQKYQILQVMQFLRNVLMSGNGQKVQQFIRLSIGTGSLLGLKHFTQCLIFDTQLEHIQRLAPVFYHSKSNMRHAEINIFEDGIQHYIGFQFKHMPTILEPYFSYIHLSKYMQIFGFILRLRHCENLVSQSWKLLNMYNKQLQKQRKRGDLVDYEMKFMSRLCVIRYKISNFLKTFETYFFFRVIEKEYKYMRAHLTELNQFQQNHLKMLDNIIKYGFIDNPNHNIAKTFRQLLAYVHQFHQIVTKLILDDIATYQWDQCQQKANLINTTFEKELKNIQILLFRLS